jgi:hypothetical protein
LSHGFKIWAILQEYKNLMRSLDLPALVSASREGRDDTLRINNQLCLHDEIFIKKNIYLMFKGTEIPVLENILELYLCSSSSGYLLVSL